MENVPPWHMALTNAATALVLSTVLFILVSWALDWRAKQFGSHNTMPPTIVGKVIAATTAGWPILAIAAVLGLLGKTLDGLQVVLIGIYLLGMVNTSAALIVGAIFAIRIQVCREMA